MSTPGGWDNWAKERIGYSDIRQVAYARAPGLGLKPKRSTPRIEEFVSALIAAAGLVWSVQVVTSHFSDLDMLWQTPGPLEVCAIGVLIWLHAKWRRSVAVR